MGFQIIHGWVQPSGLSDIEGWFLVLASYFVIPYDPHPDVITVGALPDVARQGSFPKAEVPLVKMNISHLFVSRVLATITTPQGVPPHQTSAAPGASTAQTPALPVTTNTRQHQAFLRFSVVPNDRRVLPGGGLAAGTHATTVNDAGLAPSGIAAVGRYALPNPLPAKFLYTVVPPPNTAMQVGAALPNFGQAGGGVEVFFPTGGAVPSPSLTSFRKHEAAYLNIRLETDLRTRSRGSLALAAQPSS
jgi:hypothetical protein